MAKNREPIFWFGHPAHFIGSNECSYRLACYIPSSNVIISTVGEYRPLPNGPKRPVGIGKDDMYETMVFLAEPSIRGCCPVQHNGRDLECHRYRTAEDAHAGHMRLVKKYGSNKRKSKQATG